MSEYLPISYNGKLYMILFRSETVPENIVTCSSTIDQCTPFVSQTSLSSRKIVRIDIIFLKLL
jgi:hypothetical protein